MKIPPGGMNFKQEYVGPFHEIVQDGFLPGYFIENVLVDSSNFNAEIFSFGAKNAFPRKKVDVIGDFSITIVTSDGHVLVELLSTIRQCVHDIIKEFESVFP
jgi:hypothetical protein